MLPLYLIILQLCVNLSISSMITWCPLEHVLCDIVPLYLYLTSARFQQSYIIKLVII